MRLYRFASFPGWRHSDCQFERNHAAQTKTYIKIMNVVFHGHLPNGIDVEIQDFGMSGKFQGDKIVPLQVI